MTERTLNQAIQELHAVVEALRELIEREYPTRTELNEYTKKTTSLKRWYIALLMFPLGIVASIMVTVPTVSGCFLQADGVGPSVCNWIPGYPETIQRNKLLIEEFRQLHKQSDDNTARIEKLENRR